MAALMRRLNSVCEINDDKETWKIAVRLLNMWTVPRQNKVNMEMILMDKEGDKILAQIKNVELERWNEILKVGNTYVIQNFEVENNTGQYKCTPHAYKVNILNATKITPHDIAEIPVRFYKFTNFDAIHKGSATADYLIDVIGEVVEIRQWSLHAKPKKVVLSLKDECGSLITRTLWESLAMELKDCLDSQGVGPVVLLLEMAKIKEARGVYPVALQNSMYGSHIYVNNDIKEITEFKNRLNASEQSMIMCTQGGSQIFGSSVCYGVDRFLHDADVKALGEIGKVKKKCMCVTVATITKLLVANGWIYEACPKCNKKVNGDTFPFVCMACGNESASTIPKFRVEVRVAQPRESASFTIWDRDCYGLLNESAADMKQAIIDEDGEFDARDIPEALDRLLGRKLAFRFKLVPGNTRHSISQISEDETVINSILAKLPNLEKDESEPCLSPVVKNDHVVDSQCLSVTSESDPHLLSSITPTKRNLVVLDMHLDVIPFEDLSSIQLSSTRLSKHIKTE